MPHPGTSHDTLSQNIVKWVTGRQTSSFRLYGYSFKSVQGQCSVFQATSQRCTPYDSALLLISCVLHRHNIELLSGPSAWYLREIQPYEVHCCSEQTLFNEFYQYQQKPRWTVQTGHAMKCCGRFRGAGACRRMLLGVKGWRWLVTCSMARTRLHSVRSRKCCSFKRQHEPGTLAACIAVSASSAAATPAAQGALCPAPPQPPACSAGGQLPAANVPAADQGRLEAPARCTSHLGSHTSLA